MTDTIRSKIVDLNMYDVFAYYNASQYNGVNKTLGGYEQKYFGTNNSCDYLLQQPDIINCTRRCGNVCACVRTRGCAARTCR